MNLRKMKIFKVISQNRFSKKVLKMKVEHQDFTSDVLHSVTRHRKSFSVIVRHKEHFSKKNRILTKGTTST